MESSTAKNANIPNTSYSLPPVTTLRLPVFCRENKPYVFIKVMNNSEKYRLSVNPEFLKNYNLSFKILRDKSLTSFMNGLRPNLKNIIKTGSIDPNDKSDLIPSVSIFLRLPEKEKFPIQKHTILLEHDGEPGRTMIDKYQIIFNQMDKDVKKTVIYIIERSYNGIRNISIAFMSEQYENINAFLEDYAQQIQK